MSGLTLGQVTLQQFEIPGCLTFGGKQAMAVHKLPGGQRILDVMGPDNADISWHGVISGPDASSRARLLDTMRVNGDMVTLSWNVFSYRVVIADLKLVYTNQWWIPYTIVCKVASDNSQSFPVTEITDASLIYNDLAYASNLTDVSSAIAALAPQGAMTSGTQAYTTAVLAIVNAETTLITELTYVEQSMQSQDILSLASTCGSLAHLTSALGFVGRASTNLKNITSS